MKKIILLLFIFTNKMYSQTEMDAVVLFNKKPPNNNIVELQDILLTDTLHLDVDDLMIIEYNFSMTCAVDWYPEFKSNLFNDKIKQHIKNCSGSETDRFFIDHIKAINKEGEIVKIKSQVLKVKREIPIIKTSKLYDIIEDSLILKYSSSYDTIGNLVCHEEYRGNGCIQTYQKTITKYDNDNRVLQIRIESEEGLIFVTNRTYTDSINYKYETEQNGFTYEDHVTYEFEQTDTVLIKKEFIDGVLECIWHYKDGLNTFENNYVNADDSTKIYYKYNSKRQLVKTIMVSSDGVYRYDYYYDHKGNCIEEFCYYNGKPETRTKWTYNVYGYWVNSYYQYFDPMYNDVDIEVSVKKYEYY